MKLQPLGDRVVVKARRMTWISSDTSSGLVIPDTAREKPQIGRSRSRRPWALSTTTETDFRWTSRSETTSSIRSSQAPRSSWSGDEYLVLSASVIFWPSSTDLGA
jgi:hypothetical protein